MNTKLRVILSSLSVLVLLQGATSAEPLPKTEPLTLDGDLAAQMVGGIDKYLDRLVANVEESRARHWDRDVTTIDTYLKSIEPNRNRLATILGVVDERDPVTMRFDAPLAAEITRNSALVGTGKGFKIFAVTWNVFRDVEADGLLLIPDRKPKASVIAVPDCDWTPEQLVGLQPGVPPSQQFARLLAEDGCRVVVPFLIDRSDTYAGLPGVRKIRQSQREVLWRASYQMGRTIQGYEVQKVLAAVDWCEAQSEAGQPRLPIGVVGYGEGGMIACFASALDPRIDVTGISGYHVTLKLEDQPIYRNVWSFTDQFGYAELCGLIAPGQLIWEHARYPEAEYPPPGQGHNGAAPGKLRRPNWRERDRVKRHAAAWLRGVPGVSGWTMVEAGSRELFNAQSLSALRRALGLKSKSTDRSSIVKPANPGPEPSSRLLRQYSQILNDTQWLMREGEFARATFWQKADRKDAKTFASSSKFYRDYLLNEIVGPIPEASLKPNPRSRKVSETDAFIGYEVVLDVHPDVFAYGILLVPKGIKSDEKRPVVICQHGLEGRPRDVADPEVNKGAYHRYACRLAERGFVTFAPQNAYIGKNRFRQVLRKAQPMKLTLWSFIMRQHEVILNWLATQDFVDPKRMAFYGLSYGGKTAMRIPPLLDRYALSICSADYNEWIWKNTSARHRYCYLYWGEYDMPEFDLGNTFNYAELSWLVFPRPFMVERGHDDGVAPDEWVAYEFAKTRRHYVKLGHGDRTEIEFFNGPHTINGKGTFDFLHKHLDWPKPESTAESEE